MPPEGAPPTPIFAVKLALKPDHAPAGIALAIVADAPVALLRIVPLEKAIALFVTSFEIE